MLIEKGTIYHISEDHKGHFNSSEMLTIIRQVGKTIQFSLGEGKGHGSMPIQHIQYLIKKNELTQMDHKRSMLADNNHEEEIG